MGQYSPEKWDSTLLKKALRCIGILHQHSYEYEVFSKTIFCIEQI